MVPIVLAVTIVTAAAGLATTTGCGKDKPTVDARVGDAGVDTPIV